MAEKTEEKSGLWNRIKELYLQARSGASTAKEAAVEFYDKIRKGSQETSKSVKAYKNFSEEYLKAFEKIQNNRANLKEDPLYSDIRKGEWAGQFIGGQIADIVGLTWSVASAIRGKKSPTQEEWAIKRERIRQGAAIYGVAAAVRILPAARYLNQTSRENLKKLNAFREKHIVSNEGLKKAFERCVKPFKGFVGRIGEAVTQWRQSRAARQGI